MIKRLAAQARTIFNLKQNELLRKSGAEGKLAKAVTANPAEQKQLKQVKKLFKQQVSKTPQQVGTSLLTLTITVCSASLQEILSNNQTNKDNSVKIVIELSEHDSDSDNQEEEKQNQSLK